MKKQQIFTIQRVVMTAICMALYFVLGTFLTIRAGNLHFTVAPLVLIVCAALFGPIESTVAAFGGAFLNQMVTYGVTATTIMWCMPDTIRGFLLGLAAWLCFRKNRNFDDNKIFFFSVNAFTALLTTTLNTIVIAVDALIYHYFSWSYVTVELLSRFLVGIGTTVVLSIIAIPVLMALRRAHFGRQIQPQKEED